MERSRRFETNNMFEILRDLEDSQEYFSLTLTHEMSNIFGLVMQYLHDRYRIISLVSKGFRDIARKYMKKLTIHRNIVCYGPVKSCSLVKELPSFSSLKTIEIKRGGILGSFSDLLQCLRVLDSFAFYIDDPKAFHDFHDIATIIEEKADISTVNITIYKIRGNIAKKCFALNHGHLFFKHNLFISLDDNLKADGLRKVLGIVHDIEMFTLADLCKESEKDRLRYIKNLRSVTLETVSDEIGIDHWQTLGYAEFSIDEKIEDNVKLAVKTLKDLGFNNVDLRFLHPHEYNAQHIVNVINSWKMIGDVYYTGRNLGISPSWPTQEEPLRTNKEIFDMITSEDHVNISPVLDKDLDHHKSSSEDKRKIVMYIDPYFNEPYNLFLCEKETSTHLVQVYTHQESYNLSKRKVSKCICNSDEELVSAFDKIFR